jgi:N-acetylglucosaminyldiphosphoundecaprenol N-acetyl-beta-D-mannosaminyltransferase
MLHVLDHCEAEGVAVGLYGGTDECLDKLVAFIAVRNPRLRVAYRWSPPFRPLTVEEDAAAIAAMHAASVGVLFVGLGCPKQERWMAEHSPRLKAVMIGVGAAFAFHAGLVPQAPRWMQACALEWLFRLGAEPRRLWKRYVKHNPRFVVYAGWAVLKWRLGRRS